MRVFTVSTATVDSNISGTSRTASGLTCNTTYYFRARTKGDGSPYSTTFGSATSNDVSGTTSTCPNAPPPTGLSATGSTQTSVSLSWTAVADAYRYKLERSPNGSSGWTTVDSNISGTSKTASGLTCNTTYYFRARTKGDGSPYSTTFGSATSNDVSGTTSQGTVSTPTGLGVTATSTSSVSLSWDAVTNADAYKLEYGTSTSGLWDSFETSSTSVMVTGLTPSTAYYFRVSAKGNGTSCYSTDWSGPSPVISARLNSPPEFNQATYTREVPEDKSIGYEVVTVSATDPDTGDTVSYSITAGNSEGKFSLGSSGDTITVADTLNYESTTDYSLEVTASDGNDTDTATVNITVDNVNERPTFDQSPYSFTVREGETLSFGRVSASDPDGDSVTYEIIAGDDEMFSIGDGNGIMVAAPTLDYERKWFYILTVRASDGDLFGTSTANITVEDVNEVSITGPAGAVTEGEAMSFTVSVESTTASELTVGYNLYGGTAVFGDDYTSSHSCTHTVHTTYCDVTIPANSDTETIQLATIADGTDEAHETVVVELSLVSSTADVVIDKQPSRKKVTSRIASPIGVPAIGDNGSQTSTVEVASVATSTLRFDLTGLDAGRAYAVRITARGTAVGAVSVEPGATEPPGFAHIGGGQFVWVEYGSVPSERTVVVTFPRDSTTTTLDVTVSKPDLVFIERPTAEVPVWGSTNTTGTVNLSMTIFNSTSQDSDDDESEIKVSCDPERSNYHATRTHSFDSLRGSAGGSLIGAGDREIVFVRSVCQGAALSAGTSQTTADEFSFRIRVVVDGETLHEVRLPHPDDEYRWPFAVNDTLWHPQTTTTAGLQILPSGCTLSFPLEVRARDGTGTVETAVSTTGHCTERGQTWEQGSYPLVGGPANVPLGTAQMVPSSTTCRILDSDGMETVHDCRRGDHAYAWGENPTTATAIFRPAEENEGNVNRPKIDYFAKDADVTFEIVGARPPDEDDTVHKVGRTTGWTKGRIEDFKNRGGNDSSCPGNEVGIDDHKVYVDAAKTIVDYHIECLVWAWFASAGGDSGSPVFVLRDNPDTADAVEVLLVGVLWGGFAHNDGWFIPIERVYAESLLQDKDWLPEWLRPLPVLDGAREELELAADGSAIVATFDKRDLSQGRGLTYEAVLYRNGGQVEDTDGDVYSIEVSRGTDDSSSLVRISFTVSRIPVDQRNGTFTVRVRLCPYVDSSDAATPTDSYCGGYGSDGGTSLTVPPAPENLSVTRASNGITTIVWDAVANAALYRVAHMQTHTGWTELPDVTTTDTKTTLSCESYDFRVRAKGNESSYSSLWGFWSEPVALPSSCSVGISEKEGEENEEE